jgi:hypothetical protein
MRVPGAKFSSLLPMSPLLGSSRSSRHLLGRVFGISHNLPKALLPCREVKSHVVRISHLTNHGQLGSNSTCLVSRITGHLPVRDFHMSDNRVCQDLETKVRPLAGTLSPCGLHPNGVRRFGGRPECDGWRL